MSESLAALFDKVTVMHSADHWSDVHRDLALVLGPPTFSDGAAWAVFPGISLSDERGPAWSLLAKTFDLDAVDRVARSSGWTVGEREPGAHETRLPLTSPAGLTVVAYSPHHTKGRAVTETAVDPALFRQVLGRFSTGVVVVTSVDDTEAPIGMAVGSFTSVSLAPPLVAFFVAHTSTTFPKIAASGRFCANILGHDQLDVCRAFSRSGGDKFDGVEWTPSPNGTPVLDGVHGWIDCTISSVQRLGDHDLVVGDVQQLDSDAGDRSPLVFYRSGFHSLQTA